MPIQFDNSATGTVTLKSPSSGTPSFTLPSADGTSGQVLQTNGSGVLSFASATNRAWVNFNGTGTVAIRASLNVSSITDNGTGDYTVNYTNAMPDENYAVAGQGQYDTTSAATNNTGTSISRTASAISTSSVRINTQATGTGALIDFLNVCVVIFR